MCNSETNYRYTADHLWLSSDCKRIRVGITEHAQYLMGEVWHVSVPKLGTITSDETPLFIIETAKSAIEFCLPFQANIIAVNDELMAQPALINQSPFEEGWVVEIATHRPLKFESLLSEQAYLRLLDG